MTPPMLERVLQIGKSVLAENEVDGVLATALDGLVELAGAERGMILLFDQDGEVRFEEARNLAKQDIENPEFQVSRSILETVRNRGEPFWHANVLDDPTLGHKASVRRLRILSVICHPIRGGEELLGLLYLDNRTAQGVFGRGTAEMVASFSDFISLAVANALERRRLSQQVRSLSEELRRRFHFEAIIGHHPRMVKVLKLVGQVADSEVPVLIQGESGTGKELVARAIHYNSRRRAEPFIALNCGALPETLLEAELFGYVRGAFTGALEDRPGWFERARGGTIFLDEVGEMPPALQVKLLRVLESGEYARVGSRSLRRSEARVLAATNRDLETLVAEGKMRRDLFYRLNGVQIDLPPLRVRASDVPLLARHFLERFNREAGTDKQLSRRAEAVLCSYSYPGNVRELANALQRTVLVAEGPTIEPEHLPASFQRQAAESTDTGGPSLPFKEAKRQVVESFEQDYLIRCLVESRGNISEAARQAGLDYKNFYTKMKGYGIDPGELKGRR